MVKASVDLTVPTIFSLAFGSIFDDFFGFGGAGPGSRSRGRRGADLRYDLTLEFKEACFGVSKDIEFEEKSLAEHVMALEQKKVVKQLARHVVVLVKSEEAKVSSLLRVLVLLVMAKVKLLPNLVRRVMVKAWCRKKRKVNVKIPAGVEHGIRLTSFR